MINTFNRETIAPSFTKCNRSPSSRQEVADKLAAALAACTIRATVVPGFTGVKPLPARTAWRDPAVKLKRQPRTANRLAMHDFAAHRKEIEDRENLRAMAEGLE